MTVLSFIDWRRGRSPEPAPSAGARRRIPHEVLGTALFVFAEVMMFCGLVSAWFVVRGHADVWPPDGQPRLPVLVTGLNTVALLASAFTVRCARAELLAEHREQVRQWLAATLVLGATFLAIQGYEWARLVGFGLTTSSSLYGGIFYVLIGMHALHVVGGWIALFGVTRKVARGRYSLAAPGGLAAARLFWYFVVGIWPLLYLVVYLL